MKIGEIAVITHNTQTSENFIKSICNKIDVKNGVVSFGRFDVNEQLGLHLYGISLASENNDISWDLISQKMLAYIIFFDWEDHISLEKVKPILDQYLSNVLAPIIIVANVNDINQPPIPKSFFLNNGINFSSNCRFIFGQANQPESARKIMILATNMLLEKITG
jgi:signal recognition particle receptor subunit beta